MATFDFAHSPLQPDALRELLEDPAAGGYASFEGWVRNHNEGMAVNRLEYEAFELLARKEGERIVRDAIERFDVLKAACIHRVGSLEIGELAVWVGVSARHRAEAFAACRFIIDEVKHRVPIWKKEHYVNGDSGWVNCERCAEHGHDHAGHDQRKSRVDGERATGHGHSDSDLKPQVSGLRSTPDYSRQIALKEVGKAGQAKLAAARVLVIGAGGLGVPVLTYLVGAGVGRIGIVDHDVIDASNLHRQPLYALSDVGRNKAEVAAERLRALNSDVHIDTHIERFGNATAGLLNDYELVIDCTDNFSAKFAINDAAVRAGKPAIFASVYQYEGQLQVYRPDGSSPCLRCIWPEATRDGLVGNCAEAGVLGPVPGIFGSLQALEALKLLLDLPGQLKGSLLLLDLTSLEQRKVVTTSSTDCRETCVRPAHPEAHVDTEIELNDLTNARKLGLHFLDIRETDESSKDPIPEAQLRPMPSLLANSQQLNPEDKYLLICARGVRSRALALELRSRGFRNVYSLKGGASAIRG